jgi:hypothetical protein
VSITIDGELTAPGRYSMRLADNRPVLTLRVYAGLTHEFECEIVGDDTPEMHERFQAAAAEIAPGTPCQVSGARLKTEAERNVLSMLDLVVIGGKPLVL